MHRGQHGNRGRVVYVPLELFRTALRQAIKAARLRGGARVVGEAGGLLLVAKDPWNGKGQGRGRTARRRA